ncbi:hypothetical protein GCM10009608_51510 [Pseudonocardia alaniniphila]
MRDVVGSVPGVDAVPHHRGLMADSVHPREQPAEQLGVADVAVHQLVALDPRRRRTGVRLGQEGVEQQDVMSVGGQAISDVRADEARSARDEYAHAPEARGYWLRAGPSGVLAGVWRGAGPTAGRPCPGCA